MAKSKFTMEEKREFARDMRRHQTRAEQALWWKLSRNHFGYRFSRQACIRGYIVDFYCAHLRLIVEIDGSVHDIEDQAANDEHRERILENYGFLVLRFSNEDVLDHMPVVLTRLWDECSARRTALKAFAPGKIILKERVKTGPLNSSCESVENQSNAATVDQFSVERKPATAEDYAEINAAWRRLVASTTARSYQMTGQQLTTAAEKMMELRQSLEDWKKRNESAALSVKGMHIVDAVRRQA